MNSSKVYPRTGDKETVYLKSTITKQINIIRNTPGKPIWQPNYYEHIIRNEKSLYEIRNYIQNNPLEWEDDEYYN